MGVFYGCQRSSECYGRELFLLILTLYPIPSLSKLMNLLKDAPGINTQLAFHCFSNMELSIIKKFRRQVRPGKLFLSGLPNGVYSRRTHLLSINRSRVIEKKKNSSKTPVLPKRKNNRIEPKTTVSKSHIDLMLTFSSIL